MAVADTLGRPLANLRLSVTDRCNLRCTYCMPEPDYAWLPNSQILSFEEIIEVTRAFIDAGVTKVRFTGGEPLVRRELPTLVREIAALPGLTDLSLTTNGVLLAPMAEALRAAGLHRITVSLDTLDADRFSRLTRRDSHADVLRGIEAARAVRFPHGIKLDTVVMRGVNDDELIPLLAYAEAHDAELRFIEYMDVGGATQWNQAQVVSRAEMLAAIAAQRGLPSPASKSRSAPADRFTLPNGQTFGIIASTTAPFCRDCDRARLTADGSFFTCLYGREGLDVKTPLRGGASRAELTALLRAHWQRRADRGAEERLALRDGRSQLYARAQLAQNPHLEMHTRGG